MVAGAFSGEILPLRRRKMRLWRESGAFVGRHGNAPGGRSFSQMSMTSAERERPPPAGRIVDTRSPFARLAELIGDIAPGKPAIDLGVGEPKHGVPDFVAPVLAAHISDFGRY